MLSPVRARCDHIVAVSPGCGVIAKLLISVVRCLRCFTKLRVRLQVSTALKRPYLGGAMVL